MCQLPPVSPMAQSLHEDIPSIFYDNAQVMPMADQPSSKQDLMASPQHAIDEIVEITTVPPQWGTSPLVSKCRRINRHYPKTPYYLRKKGPSPAAWHRKLERPGAVRYDPHATYQGVANLAMQYKFPRGLDPFTQLYHKAKKMNCTELPDVHLHKVMLKFATTVI